MALLDWKLVPNSFRKYARTLLTLLQNEGGDAEKDLPLQGEVYNAVLILL
jgi:hypothetical protein